MTATIGAVSDQATVTIAPLSLQVTPSAVNVLVGERRQFTVIDEHGNPTTRATWTLDPASLGSLSSDPMPIVTALATGSGTLTAEILGVSGTAEVHVLSGTTLPLGTRRWTVPTPVGATAARIVAAARVDGGAASFAISENGDDGSINALTPDGQQLWERTGPPITSAVPDAFGGLLVTTNAYCDGVNPMNLVNLDASGNERWRFTGNTTCPSGPPEVAVRLDGLLAVATPGNLSGFPPLMLIDGATSTVVDTPTIPPSSFQSFTGTWADGYSRIGTPMVDVDGAIHLLFEQRTVAYPPTVTSTALKLLKVVPYGITTTTTLLTLTSNTNLFPGRIIPDGQGGVIATYTYQPASGPPDPNPHRAARVSSDVTLYNLPIDSPVIVDAYSVPVVPELVLGQGSVAFASYGTSLTAFDIASGGLQWSHEAAADVKIVAAEDDGGVVAKTLAVNGPDDILRFTNTGNVTSVNFGLANVLHLAKHLWTTSTPANGTSVVESADVDWVTTGWAQPSPAGQLRPLGVYKNRPGVPGYEDAAFDMMNTLYLLSARYEYGGGICAVGSQFQWTNLVTSGDAGSVDTLGLSTCFFGARVANVHAHTSEGQTEPSTIGDQNDIDGANGHPDLIYFLYAPQVNRAQPYQRFRYQRPTSCTPVGNCTPTALNNTYRWTGSEWVPYVFVQ